MSGALTRTSCIAAALMPTLMLRVCTLPVLPTSVCFLLLGCFLATKGTLPVNRYGTWFC